MTGMVSRRDLLKWTGLSLPVAVAGFPQVLHDTVHDDFIQPDIAAKLDLPLDTQVRMHSLAYVSAKHVQPKENRMDTFMYLSSITRNIRFRVAFEERFWLPDSAAYLYDLYFIWPDGSGFWSAPGFALNTWPQQTRDYALTKKVISIYDRIHRQMMPLYDTMEAGEIPILDAIHYTFVRS